MLTEAREGQPKWRERDKQRPRKTAASEPRRCQMDQSGAREGEGTNLRRKVGVKWEGVFESHYGDGCPWHGRAVVPGSIFHRWGYRDSNRHEPVSWEVVGECSHSLSSEGSL